MVLLGHVGFVSKTQLLDGLLALYDDEIRNGSKHLACFYDQTWWEPEMQIFCTHAFAISSLYIY